MKYAVAGYPYPSLYLSTWSILFPYKLLESLVSEDELVEQYALFTESLSMFTKG